MAGRPKKTVEQLTELWPEWKKEILDLFSIGGSKEEVKALIFQKTNGIIACSNDLWERWEREEIDFSETIKTGEMLSMSWWMREGRENLKGEMHYTEKGTPYHFNNFNYTGWYMQMKNRFGWKDKTEHSGDKENPASFIIVRTESNDKTNGETDSSV